MKNIHILPTDKPSRLYLDENKKLQYIPVVQHNYNSCVNIYITSDEEIKVGDWVIHEIFNKFPLKFEREHDGAVLLSRIDIDTCSRLSLKDCKKIVLTSDQELINLNIQEVPQIFLKWFIKNTTCEYVDVQKMLQKRWGTEWYDLPNQIEGREPEGIYRNIYRIILPKEENIFLERGITIIDLSRQKLDGHHPDYTALLKPVGDEEDNNYQDSLCCFKMEYEAFRNLTKGAAEHWVFNINGGKWSNNDDTAGDNYDSFMAGAKWQEEKSYTEDHLREAYFQGWVTRERFDDLSPDIIYPKGLDYEEKQEYAFNLWFKQLKK